MKRMNETESVDKTAGQRNGGRNKAAGGNNQTDKEQILGHTSSVPEERVAVQAEVIMPYLRILLVRANHQQWGSELSTSLSRNW
jgi:hypothetical protein